MYFAVPNTFLQIILSLKVNYSAMDSSSDNSEDQNL